MKTHKFLHEHITDTENLHQSWRRARVGKRYQMTTSAFECRLDDELVQLRHELITKTWRSGGYRSFTIHEPKRRKISAAPFRDRVVHHALVSVLEPIYERKFIYDSYANRKGKESDVPLHVPTKIGVVGTPNGVSKRPTK